ncbi:MAG: hypothetical protein J5501_07580 [Ruminococcus sp.]|nr:hypothetical protein [Ruminococcus sp.]
MKNIFRLRKDNYTQNISRKAKSLVETMINGQGLGDVKDQRYGLFPMSFNGCEVISVYNALHHVGIPQPIWELASYMERYRVLMGLCGCNVYCLGRVLRKFGADCERVKDPEKNGGDAFIVSYWTGKLFRSSIHSVFCQRKENGILIYNIYNNCPTVRLISGLGDLMGKRCLITAYAVKGVKAAKDSK